MRQGGIREARRRARVLLRRCGVRLPEHIEVERIAASLGVELIVAPLDGATAQLVRNGDRACILISNRVTDLGALRFSIAHELAHFVLEHPSCAPHELFAPRARPIDPEARDYEAEANAFAAELLVPTEQVIAACLDAPVSLERAWHVARVFSVSILAAARRFAELSSERCAAVFALDSKVVWCTSSTTFATDIARHRQLDPASLAFGFFANGHIEDRPKSVPADAWIAGAKGFEIVEHSICSREFETTLSMLWVPADVGPALGMP
jgi:Zn-dependent peptidase ImmA (M78 family)